MFDLHSALIVSFLLGAFIGTAKFLEDPVMLLGGFAASGIYYFVLLHNALLSVLKLMGPGS